LEYSVGYISVMINKLSDSKTRLFDWVEEPLWVFPPLNSNH